MVALAVWLSLASAPTVEREVDAMTVDELLVEETRLLHPPSLSAPAVLMTLGLAIAGAGFTVMALNLSNGSGMGTLGTSVTREPGARRGAGDAAARAVSQRLRAMTSNTGGSTRKSRSRLIASKSRWNARSPGSSR